MRFGYPVSLDVAGRRCVVVGGGPLAAQKADGLLAAGAHVVAITADPCRGLREAAAAGRIDLVARGFRAGDLAGVFLAIATGEDPVSNIEVAAEARRERVLFNALDDVVHCDFAAVAVVRRGELRLAVSTGGKAPALARRLREQLEVRFGDEWGQLVDVLDGARRACLPRTITFSEWQRRWATALHDPQRLAERLAAGNRQSVHDRVLRVIRTGSDPS